MTEPPTREDRWRRRLIETVAGGVIGGVVTVVAAHFVMATDPRSWDLAELVSLGIAMMLLFVGGFSVVMTGTVERYRKLVAHRQPGGEPPDAEAVAAMRSQSIVIALTGPILAAPPVLAHLGMDQGGRMAGAVGVLLLLAVQTWLNWRVYRRSDELIRQVALVSGAWCFWGTQLALFVWATLAKLGLVGEIDSWTMLTVLMATYLAVSTFVGFRRGLSQL